METAGVEPASENLFMQLSPGADGLLCFPLITPSARLDQSVAFYFMTVTKANSPFTSATDFMPWSNQDSLPEGTSGAVALPERTAVLS